MRTTYRDLKKMRKTWHDNLNETPVGFQGKGGKGRRLTPVSLDVMLSV